MSNVKDTQGHAGLLLGRAGILASCLLQVKPVNSVMSLTDTAGVILSALDFGNVVTTRL